MTLVVWVPCDDGVFDSLRLPVCLCRERVFRPSTRTYTKTERTSHILCSDVMTSLSLCLAYNFDASECHFSHTIFIRYGKTVAFTDSKPERKRYFESFSGFSLKWNIFALNVHLKSNFLALIFFTATHLFVQNFMGCSRWSNCMYIFPSRIYPWPKELRHLLHQLPMQRILANHQITNIPFNDKW